MIRKSIIIIISYVFIISLICIVFEKETVTEINQKVIHDAMILRQSQGIDLAGKTSKEAYNTIKLYENKLDLEINNELIYLQSIIYDLKLQQFVIIFDKEQNCYISSDKSDMKLVKNIKGENVLVLKNSEDLILTDEEAEKISWIFVEQ